MSLHHGLKPFLSSVRKINGWYNCHYKNNFKDYAYLYMYWYHVHVQACRDQKRASHDAFELKWQRVVSSPVQMLGSNSGPLEEQQVLLNMDPVNELKNNLIHKK